MASTSAQRSSRLRTLPTWLLNQSALAGNHLVADALAEVGLRRHHYALLTALADFGPASQAELGRRTMIDGSDMVATVNDLATPGFVERTPDRADLRRNVITITASGRRQLRKLDRLIDRAQAELLASLSPTERGQFTELLTRIVGDHPSH